MQFHAYSARTLFSLAVAVAVAVAVVSCAGSSNSAAAGASFPLGRVPGNSFAAPLPTDAPSSLRQLAALPSCGAEIVFEEDVDINPIPTAPGPVTDAGANHQATDCLIAAWENSLTAELDVSAISDEADEIYTIYRLPGDATVKVIVRVHSHSDETISWTQTTCRQLSVQDGTVTPADCDLEAPMS